MIEKSTTLEEKVLQKAPSGISGLDDITYGGLPKDRPTLICGSAGSGKTLMAMDLVKGAKNYDEPGVFMAFEETSEELTTNFASLGFDLDDLVANNKLAVDYVHIDKSEIEETGEYDLEGLFIRLGMTIDSIGAKRVALDTLEVLFSGFMNEAILRSELRRLIDKFEPAIVIIDPMSNLTNVGTQNDVKFTLTKLIDYLKLKNITTVCTSLVELEHEYIEGMYAQGISSLMDTWINLRFFENNNERNRGVAVIKSRGMPHSNQIREYLVTDHGIEIQ